MGVVIDGRGTPLPGVVVKLNVTERGPFSEGLYSGQVKSSHGDVLCFQGSHRRKDGRLVPEGGDLASKPREILPEDLFAISEKNRNHHVAQTFRVGAGDQHTARLILDREANPGMSRNDSIDLRHLVARKPA